MEEAIERSRVRRGRTLEEAPHHSQPLRRRWREEKSTRGGEVESNGAAAEANEGRTPPQVSEPSAAAPVQSSDDADRPSSETATDQSPPASAALEGGAGGGKGE